MNRILTVLCFAVMTCAANAQSKSDVKFGSVTEKDFATKIYPIDSNASAVVIADIGYSTIEGNSNGWFSLVFKRYKRVHILNKNGYSTANVSIPLYTNGTAEEKLDKVKAVTYNLENGKVVETKLDVKANVFSDKISKYKLVKKFTLPNVKEGSIIEIEYSLTSDFLSNLQPWDFQGSEPVLWSEYNVSLPEFLGYVFITQGYHGFDIHESKQRSEGFNVIDGRGAGSSDRYNFNANVTDHRWVMKNVWALKEENFTSTLDNHIARMEFQLSEYRYPLNPSTVMGTWSKLALNLKESESFARGLFHETGWVKDIVKPLIAGLQTSQEKARKIYSYVRDNYTCTGYGLYMTQNLKNFAKSKSGNVTEINMLLTAMLKYADIEADPLILSTRGHGYTFPLYPLPEKFNYTVSKAMIDGKEYLLDASEARIGFGKLPLRCYNGHARVINTLCDPVELSADSIIEKKSVGVFIINDEKGKTVGSMQYLPGYYESMSIRDHIKANGIESVEKEFKKATGHEMEVSNFRIDSLNHLDEILAVKYDFELNEEKEDIIYLNPMFGEAHKENPFKAAERFYPVEMPYRADETYIFHLEIPTGYVVDELPKSIVIKLNDAGEGVFEYRISESGGAISLRSRVKISRAVFNPDEYEMLREFYDMIVAKHAEQIVLKKKK